MDAPAELDHVKAIFDATWYLQRYPDVAAAGMNAWQHYSQFGRAEGRQPCACAALDIEARLWSSPVSNSHTIIAELALLTAPLDVAVARWVKARWYASWAEWNTVYNELAPLFADHKVLDQVTAVIGHAGITCLYFNCLLKTDQLTEAKQLLVQPIWPSATAKALATAMLSNDGTDWQRPINLLYATNGLSSIALQPGVSTPTQAPLCFDSLGSQGAKPQLPIGWYFRQWLQPKRFLISVVVPCFNAQKTITKALTSLCEQSWPWLEIIVVDDASTDKSVDAVSSMQQRDARIKLLRHSQNSGAYAARNTGLAAATGAFITTHDSDDWSHPQKLEKQVKALLDDAKVMATTSHWVRLTQTLQCERWRMEDDWVHRNVSSLMFRRAVFETLGFWDNVSVDADTEYYYRIQHHFGAQAFREVMPGIPLAFGRVHADSLSMSHATHSRTQFCGVRCAYQSAAAKWHQQCSDLYMPKMPDKRSFAAPEAIVRGDDALKQVNRQLLLRDSEVFDGAWYLRRYPDVAAANMQPLEHFWLHGRFEGRDPSPCLSSSGYAAVHNVAAADAVFAFIRALHNTGQALSEALLDAAQLVGWEGLKATDKPKLLVVAHAVSADNFGAEQSLLQMLPLLAENCDLIALVPNVSNAEYVKNLSQHCTAVYVVPYYWWHNERPLESASVELIQRIIALHKCNHVYCNTMVLFEPCVAARNAGARCSIHVRELLGADPYLLNTLGCTLEQAIKFVNENADVVIANSSITAEDFTDAKQLEIIPNYVNPECLTIAPRDYTQIDQLTVSMVSSNTTKKGIDDFYAVAKRVSELGVAMTFRLVGPITPELQQREPNYAVGYVEHVADIYGPTDIVVNLSQFAESFGRSVLEAMAAGRVVVVYNYGALQELVTETSGIKVPWRDIDAVAQALVDLASQRERMNQLAYAAKERATSYSAAAIATKIKRVFCD